MYNLFECIVIMFLSLLLMWSLFYNRKKESIIPKGGGTILKEEESLITNKLIEKNIPKKEASEMSTKIMEEIINKYKNPMIVSIKVNNILDHCTSEDCKSYEKLLKLAGITKEVEQIYIPSIEEEEVSDLYQCPRCSTRKCTFKEVMLRAIDEPLAVKCTCKNCGLKFQPED